MDQLQLLIGAALLGGLSLLATLYWLHRTLRFSSRCPRCGEPLPDRVARRGFMKYTPTKAHHCCGKRFYHLTLNRDRQPARRIM